MADSLFGKSHFLDLDDVGIARASGGIAARDDDPISSSERERFLRERKIFPSFFKKAKITIDKTAFYW